MTQERYQEAAESCLETAQTWRDYAERLTADSHPRREAIEVAECYELAAEVLTKLASGWVLVPAKPDPWKLLQDVWIKWMEDANPEECESLVETVRDALADHIIAAAPKP